ncbi:MAG: hypothetical protein AB7K09_10280 [Planctomycetota bacterium]
MTRRVSLDLGNSRVGGMRLRSRLDRLLFEALAAGQTQFLSREFLAFAIHRRQKVTAGAIWKCLRRWGDRGVLRVRRSGRYCHATLNVDLELPKKTGSNTPLRVVHATEHQWDTPQRIGDATDTSGHTPQQVENANEPVVNTPQPPIFGDPDATQGVSPSRLWHQKELRRLVREEVCAVLRMLGWPPPAAGPAPHPWPFRRVQ